MNITIYELLGLVKDGKAPKKIKYKNIIYQYDYEDEIYYYKDSEISKMFFDYGFENLNDEVEILEEEKKFTKEDFINERMKIDKITRKEFDEMYEVKECNCGMPYCKGFIAVDKEEPQEHKIPEKLNLDTDKLRGKETPRAIDYLIESKINQVIDYLKSKGE